MAGGESPAGETMAAALRIALERRLAATSGDRRYDGLSAAALRERVVVIPELPERRGRWWRIGGIVDDVAGQEWAVWIEPARRVLRLIPVLQPRPDTTAPLRHPDGRYYDGMRRRWVLPDGSLVPDESISRTPP
jgi:hypothetical protein